MEKERGIRCLATGTGWLYEWSSNGMLKKVIRPDGRPVEFRYDALGRRTAKQYFGKVTRWVWNGNVPIHEWNYKVTDMQSNEEEGSLPKEPTEDITTWVFEAGTFVPTAKMQDGKQYSIVSDYLGTPIQMYNEQGDKTWDCTLDIYGKVLTVNKGSEFDCPFRFQGQYTDEETGLYYNRFRYYDSSIGNYISQDPIGLAGNNPTVYGYISDSNNWLDIYGLTRLPRKNGSWSGKAGDSIWNSTNPKVIAITGGEGIVFQNGYPNFDKWSKGNMDFDNLTGTNKDFELVYERLKNDMNLKSKAEAKRFLQQNGLTPHHHENMKTIQLIPTDLNANIPHEGGASRIRNKH